MGKVVIKFDKENKQQDFQYIARSVVDNKLKIGYIVVEKPWYSPESDWKYYIFSNDYEPNGFCGGSSDLGFKKIEVLKESIKPFNQINNILYDKELGFQIVLVNKNREEICTISPEDEIPYDLWNI